MELIPTRIDGVNIVEPRIHGDVRSLFMESWNRRPLAEAVVYP
ncbi:dTDP-4-dehydrorhamnose 3,5-epimerase family protein [Sphingomonas sp. BGYR3]|nr:dTDP-4-dehydrorhamnose 3,5-epimerase family protein [Sphingomonas sp. BGYR3]MDG5489278.1 dTDP-4-dehydrorhamnose 3,5-epimerase family protein [Sphingomonas sp. BGYR3]